MQIASPAEMGRKAFEPNAELPYHVNARCTNRDWFSIPLPEVWDVMQSQLYFMKMGFDVRIHSFVLMANHFHLLISTPHANLSAAMRYFMTETSRALLSKRRRINQTYGGRFHRTLITSHHHFLHAYKYVYRNPVQARACRRVEEYPYSSLRGLLGLQHLLIPLTADGLFFDKADCDQTLSWLNQPTTAENWSQVRKALKKPVFKLANSNNRPSRLEIDML